MELAAEILLALFAVAFIAGWIDSIAGGGGLLTVPALMLAGLPPATAIATNKISGSFGTLTAALYFIRRGYIDFRAILPSILMVVLGAAAGAGLLLFADAENLRLILPLLLVGIAVAYALLPPAERTAVHARLSLPLYAATAAPLIGLYDGFFGPGTGMFFAISLIYLAGKSLVDATAHAKILNFTSNFVGLLVLAGMAEVYWFVGGVLVAGQVAGAWLGAHSVHRFGASVVKPVAIVASVSMAAMLLLRS